MNLGSASRVAFRLVAAIAAAAVAQPAQPAPSEPSPASVGQDAAAAPGPFDATPALSVLFFVLGAAYVAACGHLAGARS